MTTKKTIITALLIQLATATLLSQALLAGGTVVHEEPSCKVAMADKKELESNIEDDRFTAEQKDNFKSALKTTNRVIESNTCKMEMK